MKKTDGQSPRTNGESKAIQTKSHTEAYTYTLTKREKGKKIYIYIVDPKVHLLNLGWFVVYSGIPQMQVHQVDCGDLIRCNVTGSSQGTPPWVDENGHKMNVKGRFKDKKDMNSTSVYQGAQEQFKLNQIILDTQNNIFHYIFLYQWWLHRGDSVQHPVSPCWPIEQAPVTCSYWVFETWLVRLRNRILN